MVATVISFANFKGKVGKTSASALIGYNMSKMGKKVLIIDFDAQANLTSLLLKTKASDNDIITIDTSLMSAINEGIPLKDITIVINDTLSLIPNAVDFFMYTRYLERNFNSEIEKVSFFKNLIEPLKEHYDFIFIDVPPNLSLLNDTAFYACDQIVVILQTQELSLVGAKVFINYLQNTLIDDFHSDVDILGILPILSKKGSRADDEVLKVIFEKFGEENIFNNKISIMERVKRMSIEGITDDTRDIHNYRVHKMFTDISKEIILRLER